MHILDLNFNGQVFTNVHFKFNWLYWSMKGKGTYVKLRALINEILTSR